jgi:hypothetical protein
MEKISDPDRPSTPGLHRRDLDQDQHGAAQGLGAAGQEAQNQGSARPLEDDDLHGGTGHDRIDAPWVLDGPVNGESFTIYVEKVLAPTLEVGDLVMMDTISAATNEKPFGERSGRPARGCSSCPNTRPI